MYIKFRSVGKKHLFADFTVFRVVKIHICLFSPQCQNLFALLFLQEGYRSCSAAIIWNNAVRFSFFILYIHYPLSATMPGSTSSNVKLVSGPFDFSICTCLIFSVELIDIFDEFTVEKMKRNSLWADTAALSTVCTSSCYMEGTDDVEHLFFKRIHVCFLGAVKFGAVKYTFAAAACRTDIAAGITADTFAQFLLEKFKSFLWRSLLRSVPLLQSGQHLLYPWTHR